RPPARLLCELERLGDRGTPPAEVGRSEEGEVLAEERGGEGARITPSPRDRQRLLEEPPTAGGVGLGEQRPGQPEQESCTHRAVLRSNRPQGPFQEADLGRIDGTHRPTPLPLPHPSPSHPPTAPPPRPPP